MKSCPPKGTDIVRANVSLGAKSRKGVSGQTPEWPKCQQNEATKQTNPGVLCKNWGEVLIEDVHGVSTFLLPHLATLLYVCIHVCRMYTYLFLLRSNGAHGHFCHQKPDVFGGGGTKTKAGCCHEGCAPGGCEEAERGGGRGSQTMLKRSVQV